MAKFNKRVSKTSKKSLQNALVIGEGFGYLENILQMFGTVFLINEKYPTRRARNLVYKENYDDLHLLIDVSHIFVDLKKITDISLVAPVFNRWKSLVLIEGDVIPNKEFTASLLHNGWKCYKLDGLFHTWEFK